MNAHTQNFMITGAVGALECALDLPDPETFSTPVGLALVAHPHPLFGGTMDNKVAQTLARTFLALGYVAVRMNFRGVGKSEGVHDHGAGETDDMALLLQHMRSQYPDLPLALAGFSFGTFVQAQLQQRLLQQDPASAAERLVLVGTAAPDASYSWGQVGYLATGAAGAWPGSNPTDKLIDLIYAAKTQYRQNGRFVMNRRTVSAVRKFKDAQGNYIWNAALQPGQSASLLGFPVTEIEAMPDVAANACAVAFGDFEKGYLIVDRAGVRVLRDPYSAKPHVLFYTTKRVGGGVQNFDAIKLLKFAAS